MSSQARKDIIDPSVVGTYHCWSRCVRRAFLCGEDPVTGKDYEYRRNWIVDFERQLVRCFAIEAGFHAELANHLHLVLRNRPDIVERWSDEEAVRRWLTVTHLVKSKDGKPIPICDAKIAKEMSEPGKVNEIRVRLAHPSFFMGALCEHVSRRCNREDGCSGHFWEDRYGSRDLVDESSVLVCGIYIDLNQVRAGEAKTPEESKHTSAADRIEGLRRRAAGRQKPGEDNRDWVNSPDGWLCELTIDERADTNSERHFTSATSMRASDKGLLSIRLEDYLELLDSTGRMVRDNKSGSIPTHLAPILDRLGIRTPNWIDAITNFGEWFGSVVGSVSTVAKRAEKTGRRWIRGQRRCRQTFA